MAAPKWEYDPPPRRGKDLANWRTSRKTKKKKAKVTVRRADGTVEVKRQADLIRKKGTPPAKLSRREKLAWYYRQPYWRKIRLDALRRDGYRCRICGTGGALDVHHLTYARLGAERLEDLMTLCRACHDAEHERRKQRKRARVSG
jgi:5-methylcytosine-specific restriction endonuclease McrA